MGKKFDGSLFVGKNFNQALAESFGFSPGWTGVFMTEVHRKNAHCPYRQEGGGAHTNDGACWCRPFVITVEEEYKIVGEMGQGAWDEKYFSPFGMWHQPEQKQEDYVGKMSKEKGKVGEREVAALLKSHGFEARRGQQFAGGGDSPDVVHNIPGIHIEVKRTEQFNIHGALVQAENDKRQDEYPAVFHRKNNKPWVVVLFATDFLSLMKGLRHDTDA